MTTFDRRKLAAALAKKMNTEYGDGTVGQAAQVRRLALDHYSSGSLAFDYALGGGIPVERVTLFYGAESSGKTTAALRVIADAQRRCANCMRYVPDLKVELVSDPETGADEYIARATCDCYRTQLFLPRKQPKEDEKDFKAKLKAYEENSFEEQRVLFMDAEGRLDLRWAACNGVDPRRLLHIVPHSAEEAIDIYVQFLNMGVVDLAVLDSIACLTPMVEIESSAADQQQGISSRSTNKFCRVQGSAMNMTRRTYGKSPTQIWINQVREKIGQTYGDGATMPGGKGQRFASSIRVKFWKQKGEERAMFAEEKTGLSKNEQMKFSQTALSCFKIEKNSTWTDCGEGRIEIVTSGPNKGMVDEFNYCMHLAQRYKLLRKDESDKRWIFGDQEYRTQKEALEVAKKPEVMRALREKLFALMVEELNQ